MKQARPTMTLGKKALLTALICGAFSRAQALPFGEQVQAGLVDFSRDGRTLNIHQSSQKSIVNWQSFDIAANESVKLNQPNQGVALFRVVGNDPSAIYGNLSATGQLFLSNPNGVLFGAGAQVEVGSLVATTMRIQDNDFLNGHYHFFTNPNDATNTGVVNQGVIHAADGGYLVLLGNIVENSGVLTANRGSVALGSAQTAVLDVYGDGLVRVKLDGDALNAAIKQTGNITADGGAIQLATKARSAAINVGGVIQANSLVNRNGVIRLEGGKNSTVLVSGNLEAKGLASNQTGGEVTVTGKHVGLLAGAIVDVSGNAGGGTVLIGGDYQGKNTSFQNAERTFVSSNANISADAIDSGDGGKVIVWADDITRYYGNITAKGGTNAGNGGFVETSGKNYLDFNGLVDTTAANGLAGKLLLDPTNITISTGTNTIETSGPTIFQEATTATSILNTTTLQNALALNNVEVTTASPAASAGTITVANAVTWSSGNSLTLTANSNIAINAAITTGTAASSLILNATGNVTQSAAGIIGGSGGLVKNGAGTATLSAANTYAGATTINTGTLQVGSGGTTGTLGAGAVTNNATLTFNRSNALAVGNTISGTGVLTKTGAGTLTVSGANTYAGATNVNAGTLIAANNTALGTTAAGTTVASGAALGLQGNINIGTEALTISGTGVGATGALRNVSGSNVHTGTVTLNANSEIESASGSLTLNAISGTNRTLTFDGAGNTAVNGNITTGTGGLTKTGTGTLTLSGANTYTGTTTVSGGTLRYGANNVIATGAVTVNNGGTYDLNGFSDTIGALTVNSGAIGGTVTTGAGTLTLGGNVTSTGGNTNALISGNLNLGAANRTLTTTNAADGLTVSAVISGARSLTKAGAGTLTLSGANTYTLATNVNAGRLVAANANALGAVGGGSTVAAGATLNVNNVTLNETAITINGAGLGGAGALVGTGAAVVSGNITTASASTIGTSSTTSSLTVNGTFNSAANNLTITGAGNITAINAANNFSNVGITSANNVNLRDTNAIALGTSNVTGNYQLQTNGAITQTSALTVGGTTTLNAGAGNDITLNNVANNFNTVGVTSGGNVNIVDANALTMNASTVRTIDARALNGNLTLGGNITATGGTPTTSISLSASQNFTNAGNFNLLPGAGKRWLVFSTNETADTRGAPLNTAYDFKQYNTLVGGTIQGAGDGFVYSVAPSINASLAGTSAKTYDAGVTAPINNLSLSASGAMNSDTVVLGGLIAATFDNKNVGTNKLVTSNNGINIASATDTNGKQVFGYQLANTSVSANAGSITQATLNLNAVTDSRTYNAFTNSSGTVTSTGLQGSDTVTGLTQSFDSKNAGTRTLSVNTGYSVNDGNSGNNYLVTTNTAAGSITQAALNLNAATDSRTYNALTNSSGTVTSTGLQGSDTVTGLTQAFDSKNAGTRTLSVNTGYSVNDGNGGNNYLVTTNTAAGSITQATLNLNAVSDSRTYNALTNSSGTVTSTGLQGSDTVTGLTQAFDSKNAGARTLSVNTGYTVNDGNGGNNYLVTTNNAAGSITQAALSVTGQTANNKMYDGNTIATLAGGTLIGILSGESVILNNGTANFSDQNVGVAKAITVTGTSISGGDAVNYVVSNPIGIIADITPRPIVVSANAGQGKVLGAPEPLPYLYTVSGAGLVAGDALTGALSRIAGEGVGSYAINQGSLTGSSNYQLSFLGNNFSITQAVNANPRASAGLVDLNPAFGTYTSQPIFVLNAGFTAAGNDTNANTCDNGLEPLAKHKNAALVLNFGLKLPSGVEAACVGSLK